MDIEISEDILKSTTKCRYNFSCLNGVKECLCEVRSSNGHDTLFITSSSDRDCIYCAPLKNSYLCFCPTRREIYKRYKI